MRMELTVKELAERILPLSREGDLDGLVRQLRHWTLTGVVRPLGTVHTGAGKHRKYDKSEVYFAALALELARWRVPVGVSDLIIQAARKELERPADAPGAEAKNFIDEAIRGDESVFMLVKSLEGVDKPWTEIKVSPSQDLMNAVVDQGWSDDPPSFLGINLTALFRKLKE
jgi:hypothetical protein